MNPRARSATGAPLQRPVQRHLARTHKAAWFIAVAGLGLNSLAASAQSVEIAPSAQPAQPEPPAPLASSLTGQAKIDYEAARILFADQDYGGAFVKFEQAFGLSKDPRLLWNMAVCEKNLRHYANVLSLVERYRAESGSRLSDAQRREAQDVIDTVRMLVSNVRITVDEPGASIYLDERLVGTSPLQSPLRIDLGKRQIRVVKPGFTEQITAQHFGGGSTSSLHFALQPEPDHARLTIASDHGGVIHVDGKRVGRGDWQGMLESGEHLIRVTAPGMQPYIKRVLMQEGRARTLQVGLVQDKAGIPTLVWVGAGVLAAGGLATGAYFLFGESSGTAQCDSSTLPGCVRLP
jgi:hypothetical protein